MKPRIRNAAPADFDTLAAIDRECFPLGVAYEVWELEHYMSRPGARTLVAELDDETAGFLLMDIQPHRSSATLVTLDVVARYRRSGVGSALLGRSEQFLSEGRVCRYKLQVDTTNRVALGFYERHGFHTVRTLPAYYANGADAYLMEKVIGRSEE